MLYLPSLPLLAFAVQGPMPPYTRPPVATVEEQSELRSWSRMPTIGDVNGDGVPDLIHERERVLSVVSGAEPNVKLGSISVTSFYPEHAGPTWAVGPDVDGDGVRDLAVLNGFALTSSIFIDIVSGRTGESLARTEKELPGHTMSIAWTDDVDGDGLGDVTVNGGTAQLYSSKSLGLLWSVPSPPPQTHAPSASGDRIAARLQIALAEDFDADGVRDLAVGVKPSGGHHFSHAMLSGATGAVIADAPAVPMETVPIDTFAWMSGDWIQRTDKGDRVLEVEESWNQPAAGMMLGMSRTSLAGAQEGQFEFLRLACAGRRVMLHPAPGGHPADPFRLKSYGADSAVFENLEHDFPQVIRYWREGGELRASIGTAEEPAMVTFRFAPRAR
ncbi:FG-GAP repeat protein [Planctomycetes bacterium Poly30]|uniref:FG-GAP repeat protein n=1 Tax=Saltatorellus ferox TaxID=2528018 RepID=A0A518EL88_9BACT|nr:FG-GAP repeat protein [Planctomycetes bacterium Poly30]